jgi:competence protein ComEA
LGESVRDRLAALSRREMAGLVALVVVLVGGAGLWYARSLPRGVEIRAEAPPVQPGATGSAIPGGSPTGGPPPVDPTGSAAPSSGPLPSDPSGVVLVHVAGEVRQPGVYELEAGARAIDAVEAAGGPTPKAFLEALNLAAPVADGQQILVPRRGAVAPPGPLTPSGSPPAFPITSAAPTTGPLPTGAPGGLVNVNTASATELETLPGIGPVLAQTIIDPRTEHGPFTSVDALLDVSGIGPTTLEEIRDLVTI